MHRLVVYLVAALAVVILDQASKLWVSRVVVLHDSFEVTSFFNICHVRNTGAAFSFLGGAGGWQVYLFEVLAVAICILIIFMLRRCSSRIFFCLGLALVLGGAAGNLADRFFLGAVVDFLDFHFAGWHWPAFNVADVAICTGAFTVLAIEIFRPSDS